MATQEAGILQITVHVKYGYRLQVWRESLLGKLGGIESAFILVYFVFQLRAALSFKPNP